MNYTVCVANTDFYLFFYIEMFNRNPLKSQDFIIFDPCMLTNTRYLIYILFHYTLNTNNIKGELWVYQGDFVTYFTLFKKVFLRVFFLQFLPLKI